MQNDLQTLQQELQRRLGKCMLRLQQYEGLLKAVVANMQIAAPPAGLQAERDRKEPTLADKSLGTLVGMFTKDVVETTDAGTKKNTHRRRESFEQAPWVSVRFGSTMSLERQQEMATDLSQLVKMRNELVHHLVERFDVSSEQGCRAGSSYLEECYEQIEMHCQRLKVTALAWEACRIGILAYMETEEFRNLYFDGIHPDGSICWPASGIVASLCEAETACRAGDWTLLDAAIAFISKSDKRQTPVRYGCKSWRQVLEKSKEFEWRHEPGSAEKKGEVWYRSVENNAET